MTTKKVEMNREEFRMRLMEMLNSLKKTMLELNQEIKKTNEESPDPLDQAANLERRNFIFAMLKQKELMLKNAEKALSHFDDFGFCDVCGDDIEPERLETNLTVTKCFTCQMKAEIREKQYIK